jgi:membrane protease YdiL (CAAX protease family)
LFLLRYHWRCPEIIFRATLLPANFRTLDLISEEQTMAFIKRHPIVTFYLLAFVISWLGFVPQTLYSYGLFPFTSFVFLILGNGGPAFAAMIVAWLLGRGKGLRDLFAPLLRWRVRFIWYLVALFLQAALFVIATGVVLVVAGEPQPDLTKITPPFLPLIILLIQIPINVWEEIGWRGFALPRLQSRHSALLSSLLIGVLWNLWHIPLLLAPDNPMSSFPLVPWFIGNLALTVIYTWVYNHTRGSLLILTLLHAAQNAAAQVLYLSLGEIPALGVTIDAALKCILAIVLVAVYRGESLSRGERHTVISEPVPVGTQER